MVTVSEAKNIINEATAELGKITIPLHDALHYVVAETLHAPISSPPFPQSAMDGYACSFNTLKFDTNIPIQGEIQAGDTRLHQLKPGYCFRIFTGARIPNGANTVVVQEKCTITLTGIKVEKHTVNQGDHIRKEGSQTLKGDLLVSPYQILNPGMIGFLAGLGMHEIAVFRKPSIGIIITGKELVMPGQPLSTGQIYESNSVMLQAALQQVHLYQIAVWRTDDLLEDITKAIQAALNQCDLILITGGISVGDYDFVNKALQLNQVESLFYKVKQKPGKPLWFGKKNNNLIFALPGNPGAVLTCFYQYVWPCIRKCSGLSFEQSPQWMPLLHAYEKKGELTHFLKAKSNQEGVTLLEGQESFKLHAFMEANCLVTLPATQNQFQKSEMVHITPILSL